MNRKQSFPSSRICQLPFHFIFSSFILLSKEPLLSLLVLELVLFSHHTNLAASSDASIQVDFDAAAFLRIPYVRFKSSSLPANSLSIQQMTFLRILFSEILTEMELLIEALKTSSAYCFALDYSHLHLISFQTLIFSRCFLFFQLNFIVIVKGISLKNVS